MISYWDSDYVRAKRIKRGHIELAPAFQQLADWIAQKFDVTAPLNVEHEYCELAKLPRLQVVFERDEDASKFMDSVGNFNAAKQRSVARQFCNLLANANDRQTDTDGMFVIFTAFEPVARWEAISAIGDKQVEEIRREVDSAMIWTIKSMFATVVFFFHTDQQLRSKLGEALRGRCSNAYMTKLRPFDEFDYFRNNPLVVRFDSKENFDRSYESSWFNYFR